MTDPADQFAELVARATSQPGVLGLALTGSRATELHDQSSDYDGALFVEEGTEDEARGWLDPGSSSLDIGVFTPSSFAEHAQWGSSTAWDRYAWSIARFVVDRTQGELVEVAREKGRVPEEALESYVDSSLDWYLNQVCRSARCYEIGDPTGARLEAAEAVRPFLQASFAIHERRLVPYYKFLEWDVAARPLRRFAVSPSEFVRAAAALVVEGSLASQSRVLRMAFDLFPTLGYARRFEEWEVDTWWDRHFGEASA